MGQDRISTAQEEFKTVQGTMVSQRAGWSAVQLVCVCLCVCIWVYVCLGMSGWIQV